MRPVAMDMASDNSLSAHCLDGGVGLTPMAFAHPGRFSPAEAACVGYLHIYTMALRMGSRAVGDAVLRGNVSWQCGQCTSKHPRDGPNSTMCCRRHGFALECRNPRGWVAKAGNYFGRWAYHLFESINGATFERNHPIESSDLAVSALYRRALGLEPSGSLEAQCRRGCLGK